MRPEREREEPEPELRPVVREERGELPSHARDPLAELVAHRLEVHVVGEELHRRGDERVLWDRPRHSDTPTR